MRVRRGSPAQRLVKRVIDVTGATAGLLVLSPVIAVAAGLSWFAHGRPVLLHHRRAGLHGAPIIVVKLRTMTDDRDSDGELLPDGQRLTPIGRRLRRLSLDELPQLWTVLRGDMSLVGPRPLPLPYTDRYSDGQRRRLLVKPGLTGWAQVNGRNALSWPEKLSLDEWYVDNATIALDVKIMLRTLRSVAGGGGVSSDGHATMPEFIGEQLEGQSVAPVPRQPSSRG